MRRRSIRNPMVSLAMFLVLCCTGWVAWEKRDDIRWQGEVTTIDPRITEGLIDSILETFERDECFVDLRSTLAWRPREQRYRLEIDVESGQTCEDASKTLCKRIADLISRQSGYKASVMAYDAGNREVGRYVQ